MPRPMHSKKKKPINKKKSNKTSIEKDFDKFRHEIYKFGLTGLDKKEQLDARVELAIKLGAKPKKWIKPHTALGADNETGKKDGEAGKVDQYIKTNPSSSA